MTLACVAIVIVLGFFVLTFVYFDHPRIKAATPVFMLLICFSTLLALSIVLIIGVTPTTPTCVIPHWFGHVAFYLTFSCLFFKTFRVWYIFSTLDTAKKEETLQTDYNHKYSAVGCLFNSRCWRNDLFVLLHCIGTASSGIHAE